MIYLEFKELIAFLDRTAERKLDEIVRDTARIHPLLIQQFNTIEGICCDAQSSLAIVVFPTRRGPYKIIAFPPKRCLVISAVIVLGIIAKLREFIPLIYTKFSGLSTVKILFLVRSEDNEKVGFGRCLTLRQE